MSMGTPDRTDPPLRADEATSLRAFLDYHRATLRAKVDGLSDADFGRTLPPSTMTLGGMVKHLALVESSWFEEVLLGRPLPPPWDAVDWDADRDWDWHSAADDTPGELMTLFEQTVARVDEILDEALAGPDGLDTLSVKRSRREGEHFSLRWILLHMIEEYARHNGHADLLREAIDGRTGE